MSDNETAELSREWRQSVRDEMRKNGEKLDMVLVEIGRIRNEFAPVDRHEDLATRVRSLEENQARFLGGILILNFIGGIALAIIMKIWK
jgi:hypothetical protein